MLKYLPVRSRKLKNYGKHDFILEPFFSIIYYINTRTVSVCLSVCVSVSCEISRTEPRITAHLSPAQRASPGELHKPLDEFLTRTQSGECAICLSLWFERTTFKTTPIT